MRETAVPTLFRQRKRVLGITVLLSLLCLTLLWSPQLRSSRPWSKLIINTKSNHANTVTGDSDTRSYSAAIIYLVKLSHVSELLESLASVQANLSLSCPWPILLFHTGDFDAEPSRTEFVVQLRDRLGGGNGSWDLGRRVEFVRLDWRLPEGIPADKDILDPIEPYRWPGELPSTTPRGIHTNFIISPLKVTTTCVPSLQ